MPARRAFISLCLEQWSDIWNCYHQIMFRLAVEHDVLFSGRPPAARAAAAHPRRPAVRKIEGNLYEYTPPWWLPHIGSLPALDRATRRMQARHLTRTVRRLGWRNRVYYIWHPFFGPYLEALGDELVVYHAYDDFTHYDMDPGWRDFCRAQEERLLKRADLVLANGEELRKLLSREREVYSVPNAVAMEWFDAARGGPPPPEYAGRPRPIVVYIGRLADSQLDYAALSAMAEHRRDATFAMVGPWIGDIRRRSAAGDAFFARPNVLHVPAKHPRDLPPYALHADACLMCYTMQGNQTPWGFPLKMFEYLAAGKPVVGTPLPNVVPYAPLVRLASTPEEWCAQLDAALADSGDAAVAARIALARQNTWELRCRDILALLDRVAPPA